MDNNAQVSINTLSKEIFWDTPVAHIDKVQHAGFVLERVMMFGTLEDWKILKHLYSKKEIQKIAVSLRNLDDFSISFLSLVLGIEKNEFRCYTLKQSQPSFWNY